MSKALFVHNKNRTMLSLYPLELDEVYGMHQTVGECECVLVEG